METEATAHSLSSGIRSWMRSPDLALVASAAAVAIGFAIRAMNSNAPLWLDETFTGAIAAEPSLRAVLYQSLQDVNAPLYYVIAHYWSLLFGLSNQSLRFPAFVFALVAPLLCLIPAPGVSRRVSFLWCALIALWIPGLSHAQEARCYSLLLSLGVATTIFFVRLVDSPTTKRAALWALLAAAAILTHYYALILVGFQGLAYLCLHGRKALRTWPAAFVFLPAIAWLFIHAQRITTFADPQIAWYMPMNFERFLFVLTYIAGSFGVALMLLPLIGVAVVLTFVRKPEIVSGEPYGRLGVFAAVAASVLGAASLIALSLLRPSFAERYLMPFIPGLLLGVALMFERFQRYWQLAPVALVIGFAAGAITSVAAGLPSMSAYNFEAASQALIASGTKKLVFLWDHPNTSVEDPYQLQIVGGFFFRRQGIDVQVIPLKPDRREDPNFLFLKAASGPHTGILWVYDTRVHDTAAKVHPPEITELDPAWNCRDFGSPPLGILACSKDAI
jgi:uncharacterized membrane protein